MILDALSAAPPPPSAAPAPANRAIDDIAAERRRQVTDQQREAEYDWGRASVAPVAGEAKKRPDYFTTRLIPHHEAREVARRLINSHFRRDPHARISIPALPDCDDDLLILAYIEQQEACAPAADPAAPASGEREGKLLPCPFCGGSNTQLRKQRFGKPGARSSAFSISCNTCGAALPSRQLREFSVKEWNRRAISARPAVASEEAMACARAHAKMVFQSAEHREYFMQGVKFAASLAPAAPGRQTLDAATVEAFYEWKDNSGERRIRAWRNLCSKMATVRRALASADTGGAK